MDVILLEELDFYPQVRHRTKSHVSVFLKRGGNMQLHQGGQAMGIELYRPLDFSWKKNKDRIVSIETNNNSS